MRRSLVLRRRLAFVRSRLLMRRGLAYVRSRLLMRRGLAYARSWLLMRRRTRSVVIVRLSARCASAMRSRLALVRVSRSGSVVWARYVVGTVRVRCSGCMGIGSVGMFGRASDIVVSRLRPLCVARAVCSWSTHRRIVRHRRILRRCHTCAMEGRWFRGCRYLGLAVIHRGQLGAVGARHLFMLGLH
jgi:hypothetical protein